MTTEDPRPARRQARFEQILGAAWDIAHEEGLAAVTLHETARRVGLRQPSLYAYVDSKAGLYDAMFAQAAQALLDEVAGATWPGDPREALLGVSRAVVDFVAVDAARQQLLFQRVVPGFAPSAASYALAQRFLAWVTGVLAAAGVTAPEDVDLYTALIAGLSMQQTANDPGGDRWARQVPVVLDMLFQHVEGRRG